MLYFSKIKIIIISILSIFFIILTSSNFLSSENNFFKKKINLGLDLQGGSYLLLEIDNNPVIVRNLQNSLSNIRKYFKTNNISFKNLKVNNQTIIFDIDNNNIDTIKTLFLSEDSEINPYDQKFKSHQFDLSINNNTFELAFSKHGIINIKEKSLDQAIEIVRRRIDEIGTNEPNILKRGNDRV